MMVISNPTAIGHSSAIKNILIMIILLDMFRIIPKNVICVLKNFETWAGCVLARK